MSTRSAAKKLHLAANDLNCLVSSRPSFSSSLAFAWLPTTSLPLQFSMPISFSTNSTCLGSASSVMPLGPHSRIRFRMTIDLSSRSSGPTMPRTLVRYLSQITLLISSRCSSLPLTTMSSPWMKMTQSLSRCRKMHGLDFPLMKPISANVREYSLSQHFAASRVP